VTTLPAPHGLRIDADAGENDRAAAHPHIRPVIDRFAELFAAAPLRVEWMQWRMDSSHLVQSDSTPRSVY